MHCLFHRHCQSDHYDEMDHASMCHLDSSAKIYYSCSMLTVVSMRHWDSYGIHLVNFVVNSSIVVMGTMMRRSPLFHGLEKRSDADRDGDYGSHTNPRGNSVLEQRMD